MKKYKYANIFEAIIANDVKAVKSFLPDQLELRAEYRYSHNECMPLHLACTRGYIEIVRLLLDNGADIEARTAGGLRPLHEVCKNKNRSNDIVLLLLDRGADIEARDNGGWTPLHDACINGIHDTSELLVSCGADPYIKNNFGESPLDRDTKTVKDKNGNEIPHRQILIQLRAEYLNKQVLNKSERTAAVFSGWEMEM